MVQGRGSRVGCPTFVADDSIRSRGPARPKLSRFEADESNTTVASELIRPPSVSQRAMPSRRSKSGLGASDDMISIGLSAERSGFRSSASAPCVATRAQVIRFRPTPGFNWRPPICRDLRIERNETGAGRLARRPPPDGRQILFSESGARPAASHADATNDWSEVPPARR